jgi:hypothetical protein
LKGANALAYFTVMSATKKKKFYNLDSRPTAAAIKRASMGDIIEVIKIFETV